MDGDGCASRNQLPVALSAALREHISVMIVVIVMILMIIMQKMLMQC